MSIRNENDHVDDDYFCTYCGKCVTDVEYCVDCGECECMCDCDDDDDELG